MADYVFTQNGDNNVQIGDMTGMPYHVNTALKWALEHNFQSVAAQYSKTLALEIVRLREDNERMYAALELAQRRAAAYEDTGLTPEEIAALRAELDALKSDIEAGRMVRLPAEVGQMVYVPSGDGGVYGAYVKDIGVLRPDAHDAIMRATVRVGLESKTLEYMIALENKGTHWFDTEEAARAALEGGQYEQCFDDGRGAGAAGWREGVGGDQPQRVRNVWVRSGRTAH